MNYKVVYAIIDPFLINNKIKPNKTHIEKEENIRQFYSKLEKSILTYGFKNPINVWSLPEGIETRYGGSRLYIAQKHNLKIPCIISDHCNRFPNEEILYNIDQIYEKFFDLPKAIYFSNKGINMSGCEHSHLYD